MLLRHRLSFSLSTWHRTPLVPNADRLERPGPSCRSGYRWRVVDYMPLLRELAPIEPPLFIFGGIAEAVLLDRALSPAHGDVDVLIRRDELESRTAQLAEHGFHDFAVYYEPRPGMPLVLGSSRGDLVIELNLLDHDANGSPFFAVRTEDGPVLRRESNNRTHRGVKRLSAHRRVRCFPCKAPKVVGRLRLRVRQPRGPRPAALRRRW